jgi:hypothetical protein
MICSACYRAAKGSRLPHGWKRLEEATYCQACWRERYVLRTIAVPVVEPLEDTWQGFQAALKDSWAQVTEAANWMMTQLYTHDVQRDGAARMPPMRRLYLYPEARRRFPGLAPQTVASLEQTTQAEYRAARYQVIWTHAASLPTHRYPVPLPVHNQSWRATMTEERPVVRVRLGERWWALRLKGGPRFKRQLTSFRQMVSGEAIRGQLSLYRRRAHEGPIADRPFGDQHVSYAVVCKMVAWLPRRARDASQSSERILQVRTATDALLEALDGRHEVVWRYHGDHLRRWSAEHRRSLQRFADDQQAERLPTSSFADRRAAAVLKYRNRMRSAVQEAAAQVVGYAARRKFGGLEYDDGMTGFCADLPFAALRERIRAKCDDVGLAFEHAGSEASTDVLADAVSVTVRVQGHR